MNVRDLENLRTNRCCPMFRGFVPIFTLLGYLGAAVFALVGFFSGGLGPILLCIAGAVIFGLLVRVAREMSLMLADIADATVGFVASQPIRSQSPPPPSEKLIRPANEQRA